MRTSFATDEATITEGLAKLKGWLAAGVRSIGGRAMTEEEWLTSVDPTLMLSYLQDKSIERKLRLFSIGCSIALYNARGEVWPKYHCAFERHADGVATEEDNWELGRVDRSKASPGIWATPAGS